MERLTMIDGIGNDELVRCMGCGLEKAGENLENCGFCEEGWQKALKKLAAYENTGLEPEDILSSANMKAIDKQTMLDLIVEAKRADPETGIFAEWLAEYLVEHLPTLTPPNEWVSVEEGMPKEHDSIFKKLMGSDKWGPGMFERLSDDVIVAVKFADGTRRSGFARTKDGIWAGLSSIGCPVVTHWMPMPEPPDHRLPEKGRKTDGQ